VSLALRPTTPTIAGVAPIQSPYAPPGPPPPAGRNKWLVGCAIALAVPAVMLLALLVLIIGVCGHR
jgi:hypothetical protein